MSRDLAIVSDRVFTENAHLPRTTVAKTLIEYLDREVIFIPVQSRDIIGHADGLVRFVDEEAAAVVKRFGLILFRICMIFTAVRYYGDDKPITREIMCNDTDAHNALKITETLIQHSLSMFKMLPKNGNIEVNAQMRVFYELLPDYFSRKESLITATRLGLKTPTADKYLSRLQTHGYLHQPKYGFYEKLNHINCIKHTNSEG
jgi:hypothetical protein